MKKEAFEELIELLSVKGGLTPIRYMRLEEQLGIFIYAVVTDLSIRKFAEKFQCSTKAIQRVYHRVMRCILHPDVYHLYVKRPSLSTPLSDKI